MVLAALFIIVYQLETTQISFSEWMVKHTEVHPCHDMLLSNKNEWSIKMHNILEESPENLLLFSCKVVSNFETPGTVAPQVHVYGIS